MTNNNQQFLIQHEEFNKNFIFPSINNINTQQVITLYENFKKILPPSQKYSKDLKITKSPTEIELKTLRELKERTKKANSAQDNRS